MFNPMDFLLWLSEEIETRDWNSKVVGTQLGIAFNFAFLLARANADLSSASDPVFEDGASSSFLTFFVSCSRSCVHTLAGSMRGEKSEVANECIGRN